MHRFRLAIAIAALFCWGSVAVKAANGPKVVVSILPLHSLVSSVMAGIGEPALLIPPQASPHRYALRPSQVRTVAEADILFWTGAEFETYLAKLVLGNKAKLVALGKQAGVVRLKARKGGVWEGHAHGALPSNQHDKSHDQHGAKAVDIDQHFWLDPFNARAMAGGIVRGLVAVDPANASRYVTNGASLKRSLTALAKRIEGELTEVRGKSFIVFHDAYQYFEKRFIIPASGSVLVHSGHAPSAKRLYQIRKKILDQKSICVFREPQFDTKLADSLANGTGARISTLDPVGTSLKPGPGAYVLLIQNLAASLVDCLKKPMR